MDSTTDMIVAPQGSFDAILADVCNAMELDVTPDGKVTIDDVVCLVSIHRNAIDDRSAWWKIRREVYACFASHPTITSRTLAAIPDSVRDELAVLNKPERETIAPQWLERTNSKHTKIDEAVHALSQLVDACVRAKDCGRSVLLRTNQPLNQFERAFNQLDGKRLQKFQKVFSTWDEAKKYEAHQRYNYYLKQGEADCLDRVLRDFTRPKTSRLNLKSDQQKIKRYIIARVKEYVRSPLPDLGQPTDPVTMISLLFDVEYQGHVDLIFDTRSNAAEDFELVEDTGHCFELSHWYESVERLACDGLSLQLTLHEGTKVVTEPDADDDPLDGHIGDMLRDTLLAMRDQGVFSKLPMVGGYEMIVTGAHTNYFWCWTAQVAQDQGLG